MNYDKHLAVKSLKPTSEWSWGGFDYADLNWISSDTKPTESEIDAEVTRLNNAEPLRLLRIERDKRLTDCDWIITMHKELGTNIPAAWKTYRQSLRDLPASASPSLDSYGDLDLTSVTWPTEPS
tara:strand:+ start:648 stop:1019 length:372 start_codon:yes stop_codon:yes gene_type:complete